MQCDYDVNTNAHAHRARTKYARAYLCLCLSVGLPVSIGLSDSAPLWQGKQERHALQATFATTQRFYLLLFVNKTTQSECHR